MPWQRIRRVTRLRFTTSAGLAQRLEHPRHAVVAVGLVEQLAHQRHEFGLGELTLGRPGRLAGGPVVVARRGHPGRFARCSHREPGRLLVIDTHVAGHGVDISLIQKARDRLSRSRSIRSCALSARSSARSARSSTVSPSRSPRSIALKADPVPQRARVHPDRPGHIGNRAALVEHHRDRVTTELGRELRGPTAPGLASCWTWTSSYTRCPSNGGMLSEPTAQHVVSAANHPADQLGNFSDRDWGESTIGGNRTVRRHRGRVTQAEPHITTAVPNWTSPHITGGISG